ncbi:hypothetical protein UFOVP28_2 [uncultured Caudovirales phage]|uniref:Uncharacterized protein n=1 Tax=uncultured Caudovirales phage TaxID=2100421 RepID=A0A6J5KQF2_9CAUD|nr:hypothetical protein UFOVP28_2 [uncultured Caudovirales phage]
MDHPIEKIHIFPANRDIGAAAFFIDSVVHADNLPHTYARETYAREEEWGDSEVVKKYKKEMGQHLLRVRLYGGSVNATLNDLLRPNLREANVFGMFDHAWWFYMTKAEVEQLGLSLIRAASLMAEPALLEEAE